MHNYRSAIISLTQCMLCMLYVASCTAFAKMNVSCTDGLTENGERMKSYVEVRWGTCSIKHCFHESEEQDFKGFLLTFIDEEQFNEQCQRANVMAY